MLIGLLLLIGWTTAGVFKTVTTSKGKVRGKAVFSYGHQSGFAFLGISLGKPPIRELRFKALIPVDPWTGTLDAFEYGNACFQNSSDTNQLGGVKVSEDCLYINVFTSKNCLDKGGCAVIVHIHGGQRNRLTPAALRPEVVVNNYSNDERNIVFVTVPYRTGITGWLNLAPGLKTSADSNLPNRDVFLSLKWVQDEITSFGGDPKSVTLFGHSSGGQTVTELALSPFFIGMFQQAIVMSGTALGEKTRNINSKFSQAMAIQIGCANSNDSFTEIQRVEQIIYCMRQKSEEELWRAQASFQDKVEDFFGTWIDGPGGVFPDKVQVLLENYNRSINLLIGTVTKETIDTRFLLNPDGTVNRWRLDTLCENIAYDRNYTKPEEYRRVCNQFYGTRPEYINDDYHYHYPTIQFADKFSENSNVFVYSFAYSNSGKAYRKYDQALSPQHTEDFMYVSGLARIEEYMTPMDYHIERVYSGMISNFANSGDPRWGEQIWEPWTKNKSNNFLIDFDENGVMPGQREGYYSNVREFFEGTVSGVAGNMSCSSSFPPKFDCYVQVNVISGFTSYWTNSSTVKSKTFSSLVEAKDLWEKHLVTLRQLKTLENSDPRVDSWRIVLLGVIVSMIFVAFAITKYYSWSQRRHYYPLDSLDEL